MKKVCLLFTVMMLMLSAAVFAGTFSKSSTAPSSNLIEYLEANTDMQLMAARDGEYNRGSGQTFTHGAAYNMTAITFVGRVHDNDLPGPYSLPSGATVDMCILKDTTADNLVDTEIGDETFDVGGQTIATGEYLTFMFSSPVGPLDADTMHGVELWFTTEASGHKFCFARNDSPSPDQYLDGHTIFVNTYSSPDDFPYMNQPDNTNDAWFYVQGTEVSAIDEWRLY